MTETPNEIEPKSPAPCFQVKRLVSDYLQTWPEPTEEDLYLDALAAEYHQRAEAYDLTVCTGPIKHGGIMPVTAKELMMVNRHARALKHELGDRAERERGIQPFKVMRAIQRLYFSG